MPLLLADFIHIKVCKPNLRKTLDITEKPLMNIYFFDKLFGKV